MADGIFRPRQPSFNLAVGAASVACTAPQSAPLACTKVRLASTTAAYVTFKAGSAPTALADGTNMLVPANWPEYFTVSPGDYIAVIQQSAGGTLNVTYLTS
jgi:hypothetical protein